MMQCKDCEHCQLSIVRLDTWLCTHLDAPLWVKGKGMTRQVISKKCLKKGTEKWCPLRRKK